VIAFGLVALGAFRFQIKGAAEAALNFLPVLRINA
jgi:hypothetical protein